MNILDFKFPYFYSQKEIFELLNSSPQGISQEEAIQRLSLYGYNEIEEERRIPVLKLLLSQFLNILVLILLLASLISLYLGEKIEALAIISIILIAGLLGFLQEYQAERSLKALKKLILPFTRVIRNGKTVEIPVREVVPGDIVILEAGDKVPADARLIEASDLAVDEAILTGESYPVEKSIAPLLEEDLPPHRQTNMVFMGTSVLRGKAKAIVTSTGKKTEFGKIALLLQKVEERKTLLQVNLERASKQLGFYIVILAFGIGSIGILKGHPLSEMFLWSVALAVAMIPEALPAVTTISLALGVKRMALKKALIRRLSAVETLGSVTIICSDKTGTLTKNEMTVKRIYCDDVELEITGVGYEPKGEILPTKDNFDLSSETLQLLLTNALLCNHAELLYNPDENHWYIKGDPTEGALIVLGAKAGLKKEALMRKYPLIYEIPFSSERMKMTTVHSMENQWIVFSKGALEKILEASRFLLLNLEIHPLTEELKEKIHLKAQEFYEKGFRVLAMGYKTIPRDSSLEKVEEDLIFLGFVGMIDPAREEVKEAIRHCYTAGIKPIMITGDHKITATAIGKEIGLYKGGLILTGEDLRRLKEDDLQKKVTEVEIFARVLPEDKLKIVRALQRQGQVVAMTGDGVNDAPALKQADIGIAMGITGTEVAKEASEMVLLEENFVTIVKAIEEGRTIFANIRKFLVYLLTGNLATVLALTIALILDFPLPLTALQILFINLLMDGTPAIALGVEPPEPGIMKRAPRSPKEGILDRDSILFIASMGSFIALLILTLYYFYLQKNPHLANSVFFAGIITFRLVNALNCRSLRESFFKLGFFSNKWLILALGTSFLLMQAVMYSPLSEIFSLNPLGWKDWLLLLLIASFILIVDEIKKNFFQRN
ncbi:MAG: cation-translocating P-type ATPase [Caldimicrobium sp.]|nr:cation-translocating P-type ATPase [Caldimicrobium sp.]MDW8182163.1 cation-translocating P-type ATPase [Caldimicrobium sp.]